MADTPHIFLATPMYGGVCSGSYTTSVIDLALLLNNKGWKFESSFLYNDSLVNRARNTLTQSFLDSDATHLLFIDADVEFNPQDVVRLVEEDKEMIGGVYPKKTIHWERVDQALAFGIYNLDVNLLEYAVNIDDDNERIFGDNHVRECTDIATGYLLIKREVFAKLEANEYISNKGNTDSNVPDKMTKNFFSIGIDPVHKVLLSEDMYFCQLWTNTGGKIYVAPYARAAHHGNYKFGFTTTQ